MNINQREELGTLPKRIYSLEDFVGASEQTLPSDPVSFNDNVISDKPFDINIKALDYGYLVQVGCQSVAIETKEGLLKGLSKYYNNPSLAKRDWFQNKEEFLK